MLYTLGMKLLAMSALVLALSGGSAFAGRHGGGGGGGHSGGGHVGGGAVVHGGGGHVGGGHVGGGFVNHGGFTHGVVGRGYAGGYRGGYIGARRPIFVGRPFIGGRYYDYRYRPRLIVENYAPMAGYSWLSGSWQWDGQEWIWQPGHYEPDAAYDSGPTDEAY